VIRERERERERERKRERQREREREREREPVQQTVLERIERRGLKLFGYLMKMEQEKFRHKLFKWTSLGKRK